MTDFVPSRIELAAAVTRVNPDTQEETREWWRVKLNTTLYNGKTYWVGKILWIDDNLGVQALSVRSVDATETTAMIVAPVKYNGYQALITIELAANGESKPVFSLVVRDLARPKKVYLEKVVGPNEEVDDQALAFIDLSP